MDISTAISVYCAKRKIRKKDLAYRLGVNTSYLYQVIGGSAKCSKMLATFIEYVTDGEVSYYVLRGQKRPKPPKGYRE